MLSVDEVEGAGDGGGGGIGGAPCVCNCSFTYLVICVKKWIESFDNLQTLVKKPWK